MGSWGAEVEGWAAEREWSVAHSPGVFVRSGPSTESAAVGCVRPGQRLEGRLAIVEQFELGCQVEEALGELLDPSMRSGWWQRIVRPQLECLAFVGVQHGVYTVTAFIVLAFIVMAYDSELSFGSEMVYNYGLYILRAASRAILPPSAHLCQGRNLRSHRPGSAEAS